MIRFLLLSSLIGLVIWSYLQMNSQHEQAERAAGQLEQCQRLALRIERLRQGPRNASLAEQSSTAIAQAVETAANSAKLPREQITRIDPQTPRRIGDSEHLEQMTSVEIRTTSLAQLVAFADAVTLSVSTLAIRTPHQQQESDQELWNAEVTLTHRIYSPKSLSSTR